MTRLISMLGRVENEQSFTPSCPISLRKHLRTKVTPDLHITYSKNGRKSGVDIEIIKSDIFQNFSLKSNVVDIY